MLAVVLVLGTAVCADAEPRVSREQARPVAFTEVHPADVARLQGRTVLVRLELDSLPADHDGYTLYDCTSPDAVHRTVWFAEDPAGDPDAELPAVMTVEGRVQVRHHPGEWIGNTWFAGFTEVRLTDARRRAVRRETPSRRSEG